MKKDKTYISLDDLARAVEAETKKAIKKLRAKEEMPDYLRGPRSKLSSSQTYLRDERLFMSLLKRHVPKKAHYLLPSSPGLLMRTDQGIRPFMRLMSDDRIWGASPEAERAKAVIMKIYHKWHKKNMWDYD